MYRRTGRGRLLLVVFVGLCIVLITLDFRQGEGGPLERAKDISAAIVDPIQRGFSTVFEPVGDFFSSLADVDTPSFQDGLRRAERAVDTLLNLIGARLGLDHDRVLGSRYSFPLMARYLDERKSRLDDPLERDQLLYWYVHTFLWGRYADRPRPCSTRTSG